MATSLRDSSRPLIPVLGAVLIVSSYLISASEASEQCRTGHIHNNITLYKGRSSFLQIFLDLKAPCTGLMTDVYFYALRRGRVWLGVWRRPGDGTQFTQSDYALRDTIPLDVYDTGMNRMSFSEKRVAKGDFFSIHYDSAFLPYNEVIIPTMERNGVSAFDARYLWSGFALSWNTNEILDAVKAANKKNSIWLDNGVSTPVIRIPQYYKNTGHWRTIPLTIEITEEIPQAATPPPPPRGCIRYFMGPNQREYLDVSWTFINNDVEFKVRAEGMERYHYIAVGLSGAVNSNEMVGMDGFYIYKKLGLLTVEDFTVIGSKETCKISDTPRGVCPDRFIVSNDTQRYNNDWLIQDSWETEKTWDITLKRAQVTGDGVMDQTISIRTKKPIMWARGRMKNEFPTYHGAVLEKTRSQEFALTDFSVSVDKCPKDPRPQPGTCAYQRAMLGPCDPQIGQLTVDGHKTCGGEIPLVQTGRIPKVEYASAEVDKLYLLVMVAPDVPYQSCASLCYLKHWIITNIPGGSLKNSTPVTLGVDAGLNWVTYRKPAPQGGKNRYQFYLFLQERGNIYLNTKDDNERLDNFNLPEWIRERRLGKPHAGFEYVIDTKRAYTCDDRQTFARNP